MEAASNKPSTNDSDDPIESCIGSFGRYQLFVYILLILGRLPTDFHLTNVVFLIPPAVYECGESSQQCPCSQPTYNNITFTSTVVTSWDLICDKGWLASLSQSIYQSGVLAGSLVFSASSDRFGRKKATLSALFLCPFATVFTSLSPHLWLFMVLRFITGAGVGGTMLCTFILNIELVGKSFRPYMCGLDNLSYVVAFLTIPGIAYMLRDWRHLLLATSVPWIFFVLVLVWIVPESPRWMITTGKKADAVNLLKKIASSNGRAVDQIESIVEQCDKLTSSSEPKKIHFLEMFRSVKLRKDIIIMSLVWMMCSFGFYGANQYFGRLGENIYLNVFLSACIHVPALFLASFAALKFKRRPTLWIGFGTAAMTLLSLILVPRNYEIVRIVLGAIGVCGFFICFTLVYLFSSELFPTVVRNSAIGVASVFARVGAFVAPFVVDIGIEWVSIVTFSTSAILCAVSCAFLEETKGTVLRNHMQK